MTLAVGIPKEIKPGERRVSLTPKGVEALCRRSLPVFVEMGAGSLSGFSDDSYQRAGAELVIERGKLWRNATLVKKVKEPIEQEFTFLESRHMIFTYLHLASPSARSLIDAFHRSMATGIAYETIEIEGETPLLKPMSEIAGVLAAYFAGVFRHYVQVTGRRISGMEVARSLMEELAAKYPDIPQNLAPGRVVVLGGGHVGEQAARVMSAMGGDVVLSEISESKRSELARKFESAGRDIRIISPDDFKTYEGSLISSEVIIAAVHSAGKRAPLVLEGAFLKRISGQKKKIILDIAIDQGGNVAESRPTNYEDALYLDSVGNLRFSVTNIPSLCGRGASEVLEKVSLEYTMALTQGVDSAVRRFPELKSGINVLKGVVTHPAVLEAHRQDSRVEDAFLE